MEILMYENKQLNNLRYQGIDEGYEIFYDLDSEVHRVVVSQGKKQVTISGMLAQALANHIQELNHTSISIAAKIAEDISNEVGVLHTNSNQVLQPSSVQSSSVYVS